MKTPCPLCGCAGEHAAPRKKPVVRYDDPSEYSLIVQADLAEARSRIAAGEDPDGRWAKLVTEYRKGKLAQKKYLARRTPTEAKFDAAWMKQLAADADPARLAAIRDSQRVEKALKNGDPQYKCSDCGKAYVYVGSHGFGATNIHIEPGVYDHNARNT